VVNAANLTDNQFSVAWGSRSYPLILRGAVAKHAARALERKGWGTVETGGAGEMLFRLNQAGEDMLAPYVRAADACETVSRAGNTLPARCGCCAPVAGPCDRAGALLSDPFIHNG